MSEHGERALEIARSWIGTPYLHQASRRGVGTDCLGLIRGIWREIYGSEPEQIPPYTADWSEPSQVETLWQGARRNLIELPDAAPDARGQVLLFRMRDAGIAKHLGILSGLGAKARFIHAYTGHGVIESPLPVPWRRRIAARFQFP